MKQLRIELMSAIIKSNGGYTNLDYLEHSVGLMDFAHEVEQRTKYLTCSKDKYSKWVYREGDSFPMGYIAYKDIRENHSSTDDPKYLVYSPNIHNGKYSYGDRMHSAQATTIEKGVKNAVTYLRALTVPQVVEITKDPCRRKAASQTEELRTDVRTKSDLIFNNMFSTSRYDTPNPLQVELKHMVESGHEFLNKELGQQLKEVFTGFDEYKEARENNSDSFLFVEAYQSFGQNKFRCAPVDLRGYGDEAVKRELQTIRGEDDLPEDIKGKLAVLGMVDVEHYVDGVGYRAAENIFYLRGEL